MIGPISTNESPAIRPSSITISGKSRQQKQHRIAHLHHLARKRQPQRLHIGSATLNQVTRLRPVVILRRKPLQMIVKPILQPTRDPVRSLRREATLQIRKPTRQNR